MVNYFLHFCLPSRSLHRWFLGQLHWFLDGVPRFLFKPFHYSQSPRATLPLIPHWLFHIDSHVSSHLPSISPSKVLLYLMPPKFFLTTERHTYCSARWALFPASASGIGCGNQCSTSSSVHMIAARHQLQCLSSSTCRDTGWCPTGNSAPHLSVAQSESCWHPQLFLFFLTQTSAHHGTCTRPS